MRQLYKQQLHMSVLGNREGAVLFDKNTLRTRTQKKKFKRGKFAGVEGESTMRGELFGIENLFQFSQGSILQELRSKYYKNESSVEKSVGSNAHHPVEASKKEFKKSSLLIEDNLITTTDVQGAIDNWMNEELPTILSPNGHNNDGKGTEQNLPEIQPSSTSGISCIMSQESLSSQPQPSEAVAMTILKNIGVNLKVFTVLVVIIFCLFIIFSRMLIELGKS
jgi:hypothetical protein